MADHPRLLATYVSENWPQRHRAVSMSLFLLFAFIYSAAFTLIGRFLFVQFLVPLVIILFLVMWMLPENDRAPLRALQTTAWMYLAALLCWPDYLAIALPGLPWITFIRLIGFPMAILLLYSVSVSPSFRTRMKEILNTVPLIWKGILALSIIFAASIALSNNPGMSTSKFIVALVNWITTFFVAAYVFSLPRRIAWLGAFLWVVALYVCAIGFQEWRHSILPWAGRIPSFLAIEDEAVQKILAGTARSTTGIYRVQSKFTTSIGLAEFLAMSLPFVLHQIFNSRNITIKFFAVLTVPVIIWTQIVTDSRLGMVGLFMSLLFYALFWGVRRWKSDVRSLFGPAVTITYPIVFALFIVATFFVGRLRALIWGTGAQSSSTEARRLMYESGIPIVIRNPFGHGLGEGAVTLGYTNAGGVLTIDTYYLAVALEIGVIGFVIYYGLFLWAILQGSLTLWRKPIGDTVYIIPVVIALINFVISKSVFSQVENHPLAFMLLGATVALIWRSDQPQT